MLISLNDFCIQHYGGAYWDIRCTVPTDTMIRIEGAPFNITRGVFSNSSGGISCAKKYDIRLLIDKPKYVN